MRERRARWLRLKEDEAFARDCIERLALGDSIKALAQDADVAYNTMHRWLTETHGQAVLRARRAVAATMVDTMMDNADLVDAGLLSPKAASVSSSIRQWIAGRYDRDTYGDQSRVDMRVQGTVDLHVQAVRQLVDTGQVYDGQVYDSQDSISQDSMDDHPLL